MVSPITKTTTLFTMFYQTRALMQKKNITFDENVSRELDAEVCRIWGPW
jgi:hypothetical protein